MNDYLDSTGLYLSDEWMDLIDNKLREIFVRMENRPMSRKEFLIIKDYINSMVNTDTCFMHWENWPKDEMEMCSAGSGD